MISIHVNIQCTHGDAILYPIARVELEIGGKAVKVKAALSRNLPRSVLLGTDVMELPELLNQPEHCLMVTNHAGSRRKGATLEGEKNDPNNAEVIGGKMDPNLFEGG